MKNEKIDRSSYEPVYMQLVTILKKAIAEGYFKPGERLPSESELCKKYDISPMTVRRSINILIDQDIVRAIQGKGTFVRKIQLSSASFDLTEIKDIFCAKESEEKLLEAEIIDANSLIAEKLLCEEGDPIILIKHLILKDKEPYFYHKEYLLYDPTRPLVESELKATSLQGLFDGRGSSEIKNGKLEIKTSNLSEDQSKILNTKPGSSAFVLEHIFYDFEEYPISWGKFFCRGDLLSFSATVGVKDFLDKKPGVIINEANQA